jgi:site-specific recombinase XerD
LKEKKMKQSTQAQFMQASLKLKKGSALTRKALHGTFSTLESIAKKGGWNELTPETITANQFRKYVAVRKSQGIGNRTIQNEASHIRRAIDGAGRHIDAANIFSNKNLEVPSATRIGEGLAIPVDMYMQALDAAGLTVQALMRLQHSLGLRMEEAISSIGSLRSWNRVLDNGSWDLTISEGTKGGKIRTVHIHAEIRQSVVDAVRGALSVTASGKHHFYPSAKNVESAKTLYGEELARLGLKDQYSSHSLRRAFAVIDYQLYLGKGYEEKASLSRVSQDLGHGDKRGRYVWNNYIKNSI